MIPSLLLELNESSNWRGYQHLWLLWSLQGLLRLLLLVKVSIAYARYLMSIIADITAVQPMFLPATAANMLKLNQQLSIAQQTVDSTETKLHKVEEKLKISDKKNMTLTKTANAKHAQLQVKYDQQGAEMESLKEDMEKMRRKAERLQRVKEIMNEDEDDEEPGAVQPGSDEGSEKEMSEVPAKDEVESVGEEEEVEMDSPSPIP